MRSTQSGRQRSCGADKICTDAVRVGRIHRSDLGAEDSDYGTHLTGLIENRRGGGRITATHLLVCLRESMRLYRLDYFRNHYSAHPIVEASGEADAGFAFLFNQHPGLRFGNIGEENPSRSRAQQG